MICMSDEVAGWILFLILQISLLARLPEFKPDVKKGALDPRLYHQNKSLDYDKGLRGNAVLANLVTRPWRS